MLADIAVLPNDRGQAEREEKRRLPMIRGGKGGGGGRQDPIIMYNIHNYQQPGLDPIGADFFFTNMVHKSCQCHQFLSDTAITIRGASVMRPDANKSMIGIVELDVTVLVVAMPAVVLC